MKILKKNQNEYFVILNLTDTQLTNAEWDEGCEKRKILEYTVSKLINEIDPDLITVTGDLAWAGHDVAYDSLAELLDSYNIPWAPVWGNHDNQGGAEKIDELADRYLKHPLCIYEKGDTKLGNGNYVVAIEENGKIVEGIIMIDSHDRMPYTAEDGTTSNKWAKLLPEQLVWYKEQIEALKMLGCNETTVMMHIPIYAYRNAWASAANPNIDPKSVTPDTCTDPNNWNDGYKDSYGVKYEGVGSYPAEDGVLDVIREMNSTKYIISGHEHVNNYMINYKGVKLIYSLKTGAGCYWNPILNGGTVIRISSDGVSDIHHHYVDVTSLLS